MMVTSHKHPHQVKRRIKTIGLICFEPNSGAMSILHDVISSGGLDCAVRSSGRHSA